LWCDLRKIKGYFVVEVEERGGRTALLLKVQMWNLRILQRYGFLEIVELVREAGGYAMLVCFRMDCAKAQAELARMDSEDSRSGWGTEWGTKVN
jgi:hypothetical protein